MSFSKPIPLENLNETIIEISHLNADTFVGLLRLLDAPIPNIDLSLLEKIDNNGSSICKDKYNSTLLYAVGIGKLQRDLHFPRVSDQPQDVTEQIIIILLLQCSLSKILLIGENAQASAEKAYKNCALIKDKNKILFSIDAQDNLDPSRAYEDGFDIVVVYRKNWETISIYCNPKSDYSFGGTTIAQIPFCGHPKACGSPRGQQMTLEQAKIVFQSIDK